MLRVTCLVALVLLIPIADSRSDELRLDFEGVINGVVDANASGLPPIDFDPIPVGSSFSGTLTYDTSSPATGGGTGYTAYNNLLSSSSSLTVNGHTFTNAAALFASVTSLEANFPFSGVNLGTQPLVLPSGWSVARTQNPYFTIQLWDAVTQPRSLALPSSQADFPTDVMNLVFDFQQPVTVAGQTYGGRVYITGTIASLAVSVRPPPREVVIDVLPLSADNKVNLTSKKPAPLDVAVFGETDFSVASVQPGTIQLGDPVLTDPVTGTGSKAAPTAIQYVDLDLDGELDLFLKFDVLEMKRVGAIGSSSTSLMFEALRDNQGLVYGSDTVTIAGGGGKGKGK